MATILSFLSGRQITNDSGVPQPGAKLYHYRENTTTNLTVWQDEGATVPHAQPVVCDAGGFVPLVYVDDTFDWKVVVKTAAEVTLRTYDNLPAAEAVTASAGFSPPLLEWVQVTSTASPVALSINDAGKAYEADTTGGNIEFDLPDAASVGNGKGFVFKKTAAANSLIIDPSGSQTIDDVSTSLTIGLKDTVIGIFSNGAEWYKAFEIRAEQAVGAVNGLRISNNSGTPGTQLDVDAADAMLVDSNGIGIRTGAIDLTLNAATTGANGIDAGSLGNDTWYHVWLISDGITTACLLSTSATAPTMPSGYTYKYRVGAQRTGGSATFLRVRTVGNQSQYTVVSGSTTANLPIMISGSSGNPGSPGWTSVAVANFVPPTATRIQVSLGLTGVGSAIAAPSSSQGGSNNSGNPPVLGWAIDGAASTTKMHGFADFVLQGANIFYAANTTAYLACNGWTDAVNAN